MTLRREIFIVAYVFILLLNDPPIIQACEMQRQSVRVDEIQNLYNVFHPPIKKEDSKEIYLAYALDGGIDKENPNSILRDELPYTLSIPEREGYNFAGWYTDSNYKTKITEINSKNAENMVLFAKWTKEIDNYYNVEKYSYQSVNVGNRNHKELRECSYDFLENVVIPGMPSTRERDYKENLIASDTQCMQGLCFTPEYILMTAYAEEAEDLGSLMIFDRASGEYLVTLGMKEESHLGGIAFDGENIWVCHSNSRTLERIPYEYIQKIAKDSVGGFVDGSALTDEYFLKNTPSSITCYGGRLWVATHTKFLDSQMLSYSYDDRSDQLSYVSSYRIPSKVQGIAFDEDGTVYLSTSYGRNNSSYLKIYSSLLTLTKNPNKPAIKVEMPPCSEQIAVAGENIYVIFESASRKYFEGTDGNGKALSPIDKVLEVATASIR